MSVRGRLRVRGRRHVQGMGTGRRLPSLEGRRMRIVTVHAQLPGDRPLLAIPVAADAAVRADLPVFIRRAVAAAAELRAVLELQGAPVAGLQQLEIVFVVAVETVVVPAVLAVA